MGFLFWAVCSARMPLAPTRRDTLEGLLCMGGGQWFAQSSVVTPAFASTDINMDEYTFQSPVFIAIVIRQSGTHTVAYGRTNNIDAMRHVDFATALLPASFGTPWLDIRSEADGPMLVNIGGIDRHDA